jgi:hypothetical protein
LIFPFNGASIDTFLETAANKFVGKLTPAAMAADPEKTCFRSLRLLTEFGMAIQS